MHPQPEISPLSEERPELSLVESPSRPALWPVAAAVLMLLVLGGASLRHGAAVTPDSVQYLSTAHHVARGEGVRTSVTELDTPESTISFGPWPPLYPALLGLLMRAGVSPLTAPIWINLVSLVLGVAALAMLARVSGDPGAMAPTTLAYGFMFFPVFLLTFVWSESLYVFLSLGSLAVLGRALSRKEPDAHYFVIAGALAGAAMLTRYIGFTLIGASLVAVWLLLMHQRPRIFWRNLILYAVPAVGISGSWLLRNRLQTGYFFGESRPEAWFGWDRILADTGITLVLDWIAPVARHHSLWVVPAVVAGVAGAVILIGIAVRRARQIRMKLSGPRSAVAFLLWIYAVSFVLAMILLSRRVGFDPINTRYLSPVYPVVLLLGVLVFRAVFHSDRRDPPRSRERRVLLTALLLLAMPQVAGTAVLISQSGTETRTVTGPYWTSSQWDDPEWETDPGLSQIQAMVGPEDVVISNMWDLVGIRTGLATKALPETEWWGYPEKLWDFPGSVIAVHDGLRRYRANTGDLEDLARTTGRLEYMGKAGDWSFFFIRPGGEGR